ncbi:MAG: SRPBCC domain-containing protein [Bacteroidota bacterium]
MNQTPEAAQATLSIERTFDAPLKLVWEAWTQPEHIAHWWGPPGVEAKIITHDFQVGGKWAYHMHLPHGTFETDGIYQEIVEQERVITTANFRPMTEGVVMHAYFTANGDKTDLAFHVVHQSAEHAKQQEEMGFYRGWGSTLDRLGLHLQNG